MKYKEIQKRIEFTLVICLFFPYVLEGFYKNASAASPTLNIPITWGLVVAFVVINYICLEFFKEKLLPFLAKVIDLLLLVQLASFVPIFYAFGAIQKGSIGWFSFGFSMVGLGMVMTIPMIVAILLTCVNLPYVVFRSEWEWLCKNFPKKL